MFSLDEADAKAPDEMDGFYRPSQPGFKPRLGVMAITDRNRPLGLYSLPSGGAHTHPSPRVPSEPAPGESSPPGALLFGAQHEVMLSSASVKARERRAMSAQSLALSEAAGIIEELPTITTLGSAM
jgi:hypothetical protein